MKLDDLFTLAAIVTYPLIRNVLWAPQQVRLASNPDFRRTGGVFVMEVEHNNYVLFDSLTVWRDSKNACFATTDWYLRRVQPVVEYKTS